MKANNPNIRSFAELEERRTVARYLYVEQSISANTIAKETGMSQAAVSRWARTYGWDKARADQANTCKRSLLANLARPADTLRTLAVFLKAKHPALLHTISQALNDYIELVDI